MIQCKLCQTIDQVSFEDAGAIQLALDDLDFTNTQLAEVLTHNGYPITEASIRRHLRHYCKDN